MLTWSNLRTLLAALGAIGVILAAGLAWEHFQQPHQEIPGDCQRALQTAQSYLSQGKNSQAVAEAQHARLICPLPAMASAQRIMDAAIAATPKAEPEDPNRSEKARIAKRFLDGLKLLRDTPRKVDKGQPECSGPGELDAGWCLTANYTDELKDGEVKEAFYLKRDPKIARFMSPTKLMPGCEMFDAAPLWSYVTGGGIETLHMVCEVQEGDLEGWIIVLALAPKANSFIRGYAPGYEKIGPFSDEREGLSGRQTGRDWKTY